MEWEEKSIYFISQDNHLVAAGFTVSADGHAVIEKPVSLFRFVWTPLMHPHPTGASS
jgi:hypothetical protein